MLFLKAQTRGSPMNDSMPNRPDSQDDQQATHAADSSEAGHFNDISAAEDAANRLAMCVDIQFKLAAEVAGIDFNTLADMNSSTKTFYAGMTERMSRLLTAADEVQKRAVDAKTFAGDMAELLRKAKSLEALVDRLDEYTVRQEAALARRRV